MGKIKPGCWVLVIAGKKEFLGHAYKVLHEVEEEAKRVVQTEWVMDVRDWTGRLVCGPEPDLLRIDDYQPTEEEIKEEELVK